MEQLLKQTDSNFYESLPVQDGSVSVVSLERGADADITMRFILKDVAWGATSREVSLNKDMAEQLIRMLSDELDVQPSW